MLRIRIAREDVQDSEDHVGHVDGPDDPVDPGHAHDGLGGGAPLDAPGDGPEEGQEDLPHASVQLLQALVVDCMICVYVML